MPLRQKVAANVLVDVYSVDDAPDVCNASGALLVYDAYDSWTYKKVVAT